MLLNGVYLFSFDDGVYELGDKMESIVSKMVEELSEPEDIAEALYIIDTFIKRPEESVIFWGTNYETIEKLRAFVLYAKETVVTYQVLDGCEDKTNKRLEVLEEAERRLNQVVLQHWAEDAIYEGDYQDWLECDAFPHELRIEVCQKWLDKLCRVTQEEIGEEMTNAIFRDYFKQYLIESK